MGAERHLKNESRQIIGAVESLSNWIDGAISRTWGDTTEGTMRAESELSGRALLPSAAPSWARYGTWVFKVYCQSTLTTVTIAAPVVFRAVMNNSPP